jgi:iron complex transport system permease protein
MRARTLLLLLLALALVTAASVLLPFGPLRRLFAADPNLAGAVLVELRLPRALLALAYGATLGAAGAAVQALFANPLASPDLTGTTSGAALGAVVTAYYFGLSAPAALAVGSVAGALLALFLLLALAGPKAETATLLLAGLAISALAGALTTLALALAPSPFAFYDAYDWLMGSRRSPPCLLSSCCSGSRQRSTGWRWARRSRSRWATISAASGCRSSASPLWESAPASRSAGRSASSA